MVQPAGLMQGTPPTSTQPQPSLTELGGAHIIFDALFILDLWNHKSSRHSILELSELHATHEITVLLCTQICMLCNLVRKVRRCAYENNNCHIIKWPLLPPL
jgi:hypothetical protein